MRRALMLAACIALPLNAHAQNRPGNYAEYRVDAIAATNTAAQIGAGIVTPLGTYVRFGLVGAAGPAFHDGTARASGRIDAIGRFTLDPLRETPFALSLGGGVTMPFNYTVNRPLLVAVIDIEGRRRRTVTPFVQLGLGGGARIGAGLRTSPLNWR
jgi:hypothetical protein